jgi:hypothetical protein
MLDSAGAWARSHLALDLVLKVDCGVSGQQRGLDADEWSVRLTEERFSSFSSLN